MTEHPSRGSTAIRRLMELFPLPDDMDPPAYAEIKPGRNTLILVRVGSLVYATDTSAAWLHDWMEPKTYVHYLRGPELRHLAAFHWELFSEVVASAIDHGKSVLLV